ncbi:hypothetical protein LWI28_015079 [Acer negundo]|uniref:Uncharacterized protein n=1 Tax=Acer negundo TaxID=4023 RepID=A0AAD5JA58_ACENE|nr:hypothetical protein LWI28_015079 [Acer negundo]
MCRAWRARHACITGKARHGPSVARAKSAGLACQEMGHNHPQFLDGLNMEDDYFDLFGPTETVAGPSTSGATSTSRAPKPKKHTSNV